MLLLDREGTSLWLTSKKLAEMGRKSDRREVLGLAENGRGKLELQQHTAVPKVHFRKVRKGGRD